MLEDVSPLEEEKEEDLPQGDGKDLTGPLLRKAVTEGTQDEMEVSTGCVPSDPAEGTQLKDRLRRNHRPPMRL